MQRYYNFTIRTKLFRAFFKNIFPGKRKRLTDSAQRTAEKKHAPRTPAAPGTRNPGSGRRNIHPMAQNIHPMARNRRQAAGHRKRRRPQARRKRRNIHYYIYRQRCRLSYYKEFESYTTSKGNIGCGVRCFRVLSERGKVLQSVHIVCPGGWCSPPSHTEYLSASL